MHRADLDPKLVPSHIYPSPNLTATNSQDGIPIVERLRSVLAGKMSDKHAQILELLEKEERARDNSQEFRNKRALSMITMTTDDVFKDDSFLRAIRCNTTLGPTFLDDCVDLRRHEAVFTKVLSFSHHPSTSERLNTVYRHV